MIIRQAAFEGKRKMLKGNLHCHTTRSDGKGEPDVTVRQYGYMGYDFLALTDHRCYNYENYAPESGVVVIPAMEMDGRTEDPRVHCVHVVSIGPEKENGFEPDQRVESLRFDKIAGGQDMIDQALAANNLPIVCHPEWSGTGASELEEMQDFGHMEIWNSACAMGYRLDMYASYWDELLCHGRKIYGVASDDAHHIHQMGHGYIKVNAEKNVASILDAIRKGAFYASCGPEIYDFFVDTETGKATVVSSPVETIRFRHFHVPYRVIEGKDICGAQIDVIPGTNYIRAEVIDKEGRRAWTNPIFLDV